LGRPEVKKELSHPLRAARDFTREILAYGTGADAGRGAPQMIPSRRIIIAALGLLMVHIVVLVTLGTRPPGPVVSDAFQLGLGICCLVATLQAARRSNRLGRYFWQLAALSFFLYVLAQSLTTYDEGYRASRLIEWLINLLFFFGSAPLWMTLFLDPDREPEGFDPLLLLDLMQAAVFAVAAYLYFFYFPSQGESGSELAHSVWAPYFIYNGLLLGALSLRAVLTESDVVRGMFGRMAIYSLVALTGDYFYYYGPGRNLQPGAWFDLVWSCTLATGVLLAATWHPSGESSSVAAAPVQAESSVVTQLFPLFFPACVLLMSARIAQEQVTLASVVVLISFSCSSVRLLATQQRQRRSTEALRQNHGLLQAVIEGTTDAVFVKDMEGRYLMINTAGARLVGRNAEEVLGKSDLDMFSPETARQIMDKDRMVIREGVTRTYEEIGTAAGVTRVYLATKGPYRDAKGRVIGLVGISHDITEKRKIEEQLRHSQKMEAIGKLAGGVAHDFNNLLTVIKGHVSMLTDSLRGNPGPMHSVEQIDEAADRAAALTHQLLAFSRRQVLQPKALNLNAVITDLEKMLRRVIGEDVDMSTRMAPNLGTVRADRSQMEQVIMNLVVNARDAMPHGGKLTLETANVELDEAYASTRAGVRPGRYAMLAVSDSGIGMDSETVTQVFEPFFTTKEMGRGTGLGLSMVDGIVRQSGGHISVYSEPGRGATFKVHLPLVDAPADEAGPEKTAATAARGRETVMVVEDDKSLRELVRVVLTKCGYTVLMPDQASEAEKLCQQHPVIHLLLTDVVMPGMNGKEVASRVTQHHPETLVLFMSGYTNNAIVHHGIIEDGVFFLQKPFSPAGLADKVREVLDREGDSRPAKP
jgi:PAS domain S-box-containing protein